MWQLKYSVTHTHTHTHTHTEGLLWTKDRELYLTIQSTHNRLTSMPSAGCGIRTRNTRQQVAADPHLRPPGQRHRTVCTLEAYVYTNSDRPFMVSNNTISVSQGMQPVCSASCTERLSLLRFSLVPSCPPTLFLRLRLRTCAMVSLRTFILALTYTCTSTVHTTTSSDGHETSVINAQTYGHRGNYESTAQSRPI